MNKCENDFFVSYNITKLIKNTAKINIIKQLGCDEKCFNGLASDFEWFDMWEGASLLCAGHKELENYADELRGFGLSPVCYLDFCRQSSICRWKAANGMEDNDANTLPKLQGARSGNYVKQLLGFDCTDMEYLFVDTSDYVTKFTNTSLSISHMCEKMIDLIGARNNTCVILTVDLFEGGFERPDPYKANTVFLKKKSDELLNPIEKNILTSQLLIELILLLKKEKNIRILLREGGEYLCSASLIEYLDRRRLFAGDVWIETDRNRLSESLFNNKTDIRIRPLVDTKKIDFSQKELIAMFREYPVGAFVFKSGRGNSVLNGALREITRSEEHAELLMELTCI